MVTVAAAVTSRVWLTACSRDEREREGEGGGIERETYEHIERGGGESERETYKHSGTETERINPQMDRGTRL